MKYHSRRLLLLLLPGFLSASAVAQIASEGVEKHYLINARSASLGDATTADPHDASSAFWNPGTLVFLKAFSAVATVSQENSYSGDRLMTASLNVAVPIGSSWGLALGLTEHTPLTGFAAFDQGEASFSLSKIDLCIGFAPFPVLSIGINPAIEIGQGIGGQKPWAPSINAGIVYSPGEGVSYAFVYKGFGKGIPQPYDQPANFESLSYNLDPVSLSNSWQLAASVVIPARKEPKLFSLHASGERVIQDRVSLYKMGVEWWVFPFAALRFGYWIGPLTTSARYGIGFARRGLTLDYAIAPSKLEPRFQQLTISYSP